VWVCVSVQILMLLRRYATTARPRDFSAGPWSVWNSRFLFRLEIAHPMLHRGCYGIAVHQKLRPSSPSVSMSHRIIPCLLMCCFWCTERAACYAECVTCEETYGPSKIVGAARVGAGMNTAYVNGLKVCCYDKFIRLFQFLTLSKELEYPSSSLRACSDS